MPDDAQVPMTMPDIAQVPDTATEGLPPLTVAVQAGGESRRMGTSKALLSFGGRPLLCRIVERVAPIADEILITTNEPERLDFLDGLACASKIRLIRDICDRRGSVRGLYTALSAATHELVALCACDMIAVSADLFAAEARRACDGAYDLVIPYDSQGFEPFHALYRRDPCLGAVARCLEHEDASMRSVVLDKDLNVCFLTMDDVRAVVPEGGCFINCNTPDELARAEARLYGLP